LLRVVDHRGNTAASCRELPQAAQIDRRSKPEWQKRQELGNGPRRGQRERPLIENGVGKPEDHRARNENREHDCLEIQTDAPERWHDGHGV
jgi:hypothetical protein